MRCAVSQSCATSACSSARPRGALSCSQVDAYKGKGIRYAGEVVKVKARRRASGGRELALGVSYYTTRAAKADSERASCMLRRCSAKRRSESCRHSLNVEPNSRCKVVHLLHVNVCMARRKMCFSASGSA